MNKQVLPERKYRVTYKFCGSITTVVVTAPTNAAARRSVWRAFAEKALKVELVKG